VVALIMVTRTTTMRLNGGLGYREYLPWRR